MALVKKKGERIRVYFPDSFSFHLGKDLLERVSQRDLQEEDYDALGGTFASLLFERIILGDMGEVYRRAAVKADKQFQEEVELLRKMARGEVCVYCEEEGSNPIRRYRIKSNSAEVYAHVNCLVLPIKRYEEID